MADADRTVTPAGTGLRFGIAAALWFMLLATLMFVVPMQIRVFDEFAVTLPTSTQIVIDIAMLLADYGWVVAPALVPLFVVALFLTYLIRHRNKKRWLMAVWSLILMAPPAILLVFIWLSMWLTRVRLAEGLQR